MVDRSFIRVKAMAYLPNAAGTHHAVLKASDPSDGRTFHRLLGGGVEPGERSEEAVVREIAEELRATLLEPRLLGVLENVFTYDGQSGPRGRLRVRRSAGRGGRRTSRGRLVRRRRPADVGRVATV